MSREGWMRAWQRVPKPVRVPIVLTIGLTIVGVGIALLVLPGPGIVVIIVGVALLATEFAWARSLLDHGKHHSRNFFQAARTLLTRSRGQAESPINPSDEASARPGSQGD